MEHIRQREGTDCVVACLAMLADLPYDEVASSLERGWESRGYGIERIGELLAAMLERKCRSSKKRPYKPLADHAVPRLGSYVFSIRKGESGPCHAVAYRDGYVHDPELARPAPIETFRRRRWNLIGVIGLVEAMDAWPRRSSRKPKESQTELFE